MKNDLIEKIEIAFQKIPRGKIGIRQAAAIDSRLNEPGPFYDLDKFNKACAEDNEVNWQDIPFDVLAKHPSVFSFLDDAGFKFVLPAVMRWSLSDAFVDRWDVLGFMIQKILPDSPTTLSAKTLSQRWLLSKTQIEVLVEWLEELCLNGTIVFDSLEKELLEEWKVLAT